MNRHSTTLEQRLDALAHRIIGRFPESRAATVLVELAVFTAKQAWACVFGAAMLAVLLATRLWYPDDVALARNDAVTLAAVLIQVLNPRRWATAVLAGAIYLNFFTHHYILDLRWLLLAAVLVVFGRSWMHFRVFRLRLRMPLVLSFVLVALFIWFAENIATWSNAWAYPDQLNGWQFVSVSKLGSWLLLMIISVVLVTWVYPPQPPDPRRAESATPDGFRLEDEPGDQPQNRRNDGQQAEDPWQDPAVDR